MAELLRAIIVITAVVLSILLVRFMSCRIGAVTKIRTLKKLSGADVRILRLPVIPFLRPCASPDMAVEIGRKVYFIRFISGRSHLSFLHFASRRFAVVYTKLRFTISGIFARGARRGFVRGQGTVDTSRQRVYVIPEMKIPSAYEGPKKEIVEVMLLCPAPCEVTYVTEAKTSIRAAFTGDIIYGRMIFTPDTLVSFADRMRREEEYEKRRSNGWE